MRLVADNEIGGELCDGFKIRVSPSSFCSDTVPRFLVVKEVHVDGGRRTIEEPLIVRRFTLDAIGIVLLDLLLPNI